MFYSTQILARRGPLGMVWLAAHMHEQLKRSQVSALRLLAAVDAVLHPEAPLALRLSGQLLLGLARLYSKQIGYLHQDCQDALVRLQLAFQASSKAGEHGAHTLAAEGGDGVAATDLQMMDMDANWVMMVDMVESQLLQPRSLNPYSNSWLLHDIQDVGHAADLGPGLTDRLGQSTLVGTMSKLKSSGGLRGRNGDDGDDVQPLRDQTNRGRSRTPGISRLASQAESMFAVVASSGRQRSGGSSGRRVSVDMPVMYAREDLVQAEQDEMFEGVVDPLDLLGDVEVEVLREAPSSAARQAHAAAQLLGELGRVNSHTRRQLTLGGGMQLATHAGDTPSTAHASKAGGPSLWRGGGAGGMVDDLGQAPGTHHSQQASHGDHLRGLPPGTHHRSDGSPGSGLLDMNVDLAELLGADPLGGGSQQGSVMRSPRVGAERQTPASPGGQHPHLDLGLPGQHESPSGTDAQTQPQPHKEVAVPDAPAAIPPPAAGHVTPAMQPARRSSARLHQPPPAQPQPAAGEAEQQGVGRAGKKRHAARSVAAAGQSSHLPWKSGKLGLQLPRRAPLMDLPAPDVRKGPDPTLIRAADCRALLQDTSSLLVKRGLAAYRQKKRTRMDDSQTQSTGSLEQLLVRPALHAPWAPSFLAAAQARLRSAQVSDHQPANSPNTTLDLSPARAQSDRQPPAPAPPQTQVYGSAGSHRPSPPAPGAILAASPVMPAPSLSTGARAGPSAWPTPLSGLEGPPVLQSINVNLGSQPPPVSQSKGPVTGHMPMSIPTLMDHDHHQYDDEQDLENQDPHQQQQPEDKQTMLSQPSHAPIPSPAAAFDIPPPPGSSPAVLAPHPAPQPTVSNHPALGITTEEHHHHHHHHPATNPSPHHAAQHVSPPALLDVRSPSAGPQTSPNHHSQGYQSQSGGMMVPPVPLDVHRRSSSVTQAGLLQSGSLPLSTSGHATSSLSLSPQGLQHQDRAAGTLMDVVRVTTSTLPPELQEQVLSLQQTQPSQCAGDLPPFSQAYGHDLPTQTSQQQQHLDAPVVLSQEITDGLTQCDALPLSQIVASRQPAGTQAPGARLDASRCFYDLLVLHSRGLVSLSQQAAAAGAASQGTQSGDSNTELHVQMTQQGLSVALKC